MDNLFGVIGHPIEHSLSPFLHKLLMEKMDVEGSYHAFHVQPGNLDQGILGARALGIKGLNVTIPYKEKLEDLVVDIDDYAKEIGAINTLKLTEKGYKGYNTDGYGFLKSLTIEGITIKNKTVAIIGAGGAAKALALLVAKEGAKKIIIINRNIDRAQMLVQSVREYYKIPMVIHGLNNLFVDTDMDLCIQTTPVGMYPKEDQLIIDHAPFYEQIKVGVDIIYNPHHTSFLEMCKSHGAKVVHGIGMLVFQGIRSFEIWQDVQVPDSIQMEIYHEMVEHIRRSR